MVLGGEEWVEDSFEILVRNAFPVVDDVKLGAAAGCNLNANMASLVRSSLCSIS
mgnify:CR=1 FL=1